MGIAAALSVARFVASMPSNHTRVDQIQIYQTRNHTQTDLIQPESGMKIMLIKFHRHDNMQVL